MIDTRFSAESFEAAGLDSDAAEELAKELRLVVEKTLLTFIEPKMEELVSELNDLGHDLTPRRVGGANYLSYSDERDNDPRSCKLRIEANCIVSAGYAHLIYLK